MALRYGYFDSDIIGVDEEGMPIFDRAETSDLFALFFSMLVSDGVMARPSTCFRIRASGSGLKLERDPGFGMVKGHFCYDNEVGELLIDRAPQAHSRIDRVIMRCNYLDRIVEILIKKGAEAVRPVPPELIRPSAGDYFELCLAEIRLTPGQKVITQSSITDTRADSSVCGYITQLIDRLDTSVFFAQLNSFYEDFVNKSNVSYEEFRKMSLDAYNSITEQLNNYFVLISSQGNQKYEEFKTEIITYINNLKSKGDTDLAELLQGFLDFREQGEGDFLQWFERIQATLAAAENGKLLEHIEYLLTVMYDVGTAGDVDQIIGGTYVDDSEDGFFETGTEQDVDEIISGTFVEDEPEETTQERIQAIVDRSFGEVQENDGNGTD
jgi:hypothetical protein